MEKTGQITEKIRRNHTQMEVARIGQETERYNQDQTAARAQLQVTSIQHVIDSKERVALGQQSMLVSLGSTVVTGAVKLGGECYANHTQTVLEQQRAQQLEEKEAREARAAEIHEQGVTVSDVVSPIIVCVEREESLIQTRERMRLELEDRSDTDPLPPLDPAAAGQKDERLSRLEMKKLDAKIEGNGWWGRVSE